MFAKATRNFLRDTDPGGDLIPVSSLNDSDTLQLLSLVVKKKKFWCWQRPKYQFLSVTINDILTKDQFLNPVVVESDFVKYEGKFEDVVKGTVETALGRLTLNAGGLGLVESQSSFGTLRKQEVDLQQLIREAAERTINLQSPVLHQVLEHKNEVLCVVTQKIVTTQKCVISEHVQIEEKCGGALGLKTKRVEVSVSEDGNVTRDSNVVLEIPTDTPIAFRVLELYVKEDGQFEFCLLHEKQGGFERGSTDGRDHLDAGIFGEFIFPFVPDSVDGKSEAVKLTPVEGPLSALKHEALLRVASLQQKRRQGSCLCFSPTLGLPAAPAPRPASPSAHSGLVAGKGPAQRIGGRPCPFFFFLRPLTSGEVLSGSWEKGTGSHGIPGCSCLGPVRLVRGRLVLKTQRTKADSPLPVAGRWSGVRTEARGLPSPVCCPEWTWAAESREGPGGLPGKAGGFSSGVSPRLLLGERLRLEGC
ncbi:gasdermin-E isoform 2-T3 [Sarcophilus harrisii]